MSKAYSDAPVSLTVLSPSGWFRAWAHLYFLLNSRKIRDGAGSVILKSIFAARW
ncbi:MAG TPA: hypothetical protein VGG72_22450 [Bryobacteraceae bacterium]